MMQADTPIINRVAQSGLITLDLATFLPQEPVVSLDLQPFLFKGLILREKDFRAELKAFDWNSFQNKTVAVFCSSDAIVPRWAYMLIATYLAPVAQYYSFGSAEEVLIDATKNKISKIELNLYQDQRVIIKGCGERSIPEAIYVEITRLLVPVAKSIMFGEACSTVPVFKKKK